MKKLKVAVWIAVLYIMQNIFGGFLAIGGVAADLLLGFTAAYAFCGRKFRSVMWVTVICAVLDATCSGRVFPIVAFLCGMTGIIAYGLRPRLRFIPGGVKIVCVTASMSCVTYCIELLTAWGQTSAAELVGATIVPSVVTAVAACVIYLLAGRTLFADEDKRLIW